MTTESLHPPTEGGGERRGDSERIGKEERGRKKRDNGDFKDILYSQVYNNHRPQSHPGLIMNFFEFFCWTVHSALLHSTNWNFMLSAHTPCVCTH